MSAAGVIVAAADQAAADAVAEDTAQVMAACQAAADAAAADPAVVMAAGEADAEAVAQGRHREGSVDQPG